MMKYIVILTDGMADETYAELDGQSPMEAAYTPLIDALARQGEIGMVQTVPKGMAPGSDVANLSVMGYDPLQYHTGRSPLEAISMGVELTAEQATMRCNLVTLSEEDNLADRTMVDYSAGEITTEEAGELITSLKEELDDALFTFHAGISYRHLLVWDAPKMGVLLTPPHDISGQAIKEYLPQKEGEYQLLSLMEKSNKILSNHPINKKRVANGQNPANSVWFWGLGKKTVLDPFKTKYGLDGVAISAVDLVKGIAKAAALATVDVPGATGTVHTDFSAKAQAALQSLKEGKDYVYVHLEAPDESSHQGQLKEKVHALELIEERVIKPMVEELVEQKESFRLLILSDHPTPVRLKTHTSEPVPFVLYDHTNVRDVPGNRYSERVAEQSGLHFKTGPELAEYFLQTKERRVKV